jgi:hypothetical protein
MGIDIGALQAIVLRNVPPTSINYLQRAGRAGRRADSVAFVLTYCQRRPHDRHFFQDPRAIIAGPVRPPKIDLANPKIRARHANAEVLAEYWSWLSGRPVGNSADAFRRAGSVGSYYDDRIEGLGITPHEHLRDWLADPSNAGACQGRLTEAFGIGPEEARAELARIASAGSSEAEPLTRAARDAVGLLGSYRQEFDRASAESEAQSPRPGGRRPANVLPPATHRAR